MASNAAVARSPIRVEGASRVAEGWLVSDGQISSAELRISDQSPLAKVVVRADEAFLGVIFGRSERRDFEGGTVLVVGSGPGEWTLIGPVGGASAIVAWARSEQPQDGFASVVDITHGRALVRLSGDTAPEVLAKVCAVNLDDAVTPNGSAFRSSVAKLVTDVVRNDLSDATRSYLLHCERSSGQYLFDSLLDVGTEFAIAVEAISGQS